MRGTKAARRLLALHATLGLAFGLAERAAAQAAPDAAQAAAHIEAARALAGKDLTPPFDFFCVPGNARPNSLSAPPLEPAKLFDNLYVAGNSETVVYAITTSAGIVLIDSGFANEVETVLIPGLRALGLDPADVRLILLGHGHSDHYGGAAYFQAKYGTHVGTTAADWDTIAQTARARPGDPAPPSRDRVLREGEPIVLGDTTITPVEVPGHTPGSLAFIFPVFEGGTRHMAGLFGGTVLASSYTPMPGLRQYVDSIAHYLDVAARMGVDVEIQNHPLFDATPKRLAALAARRPGEPNPFVMGTARYQRFWRIVSNCMQADIIRKSSR
jgi:metallo-beta-lactamase class B